MKKPSAKFSGANHAISAGFATYLSPENQLGGLRRRICAVIGHKLDLVTPINPNGYSPSEVGKCQRCGNWIKWFVVGQHRFGGMAANEDSV